MTILSMVFAVITVAVLMPQHGSAHFWHHNHHRYPSVMERMNRMARHIDRTMSHAFGYHPLFDESVGEESLTGMSPFHALTELDRHLSHDPFFGPLYTQQMQLDPTQSTEETCMGEKCASIQSHQHPSSMAMSNTAKPHPLNLFGGLADTELMQIPTMRCDVHEDAEKYEVSAELPGVPKDSIQLDIHDGVLSIRAEKKHEYSEFDEEDKSKQQNEQNKGDSDGSQTKTAAEKPQRRVRRYERSYGSVERRFVLPDDVQEDNIAASYNDGVLRITLPRLSRSAKPAGRRLQIQ